MLYDISISLLTLIRNKALSLLQHILIATLIKIISSTIMESAITKIVTLENNIFITIFIAKGYKNNSRTYR